MDLLSYLYNAPFSTESLFLGYANSFFPMWIDDSGSIEWFSPDPRAIFPLDKIKISRSLRQTLRKHQFEFTVNHAFDEVIRRCSERTSCWISKEIIDIYNEFHRQGYAHSVETWQNGVLAGGLYGVAIGGAFFGESMFAHVSDASKAAFAMLTAHLNERGFSLLDTQFINPHTESLGAVEIPRIEYLRRLHTAVSQPCIFGADWHDYSHKYF